MPVFGRREKFEAKTARLREQLLQEVGAYHNPGDVPAQRVEHFARALGQPVPPYLMLPYSKQGALFAPAFARAGEELDDNPGFYSPRLGMAFIDTGCGSPKEVEQTLAHELFHHRLDRYESNMRSLRAVYSSKLLPESFTGFCSPRGGKVNEESYATLAAGSCIQLMHGLSGKVDAYGMPEKYAGDAVAYACGAIAWEALCHHNPDIIEPMLAVHADKMAMGAVISEVNAVRSGLFEDMHHIQIPPSVSYEEREVAFRLGADIIFGAVDMSWSDAVELSASGQSAFDRYAAEKCAAYEAQNPGAFAA
ncbi:MAG TPA: hypothetical protein VLG11_01310 [Candidatus Saccharimonadales bacterium]|nr:hypothetical protein [Candidatus Saccharimonadales bacterium]